MKRKSNFIFYPSAVIILINALYLGVHGEEKFWQEYLLIGATILLVFAYAIGLSDRYSAFKAFRSNFVFLYNETSPKRFVRWRRFSASVSVAFSLISGTLILIMPEFLIHAGIILIFIACEEMLYYFFGSNKKLFRLGITENVILISNGGLKIIPFSGLSSVEQNHDELLFKYKNGTVRYMFHPSGDEKFEAALQKLSAEKHFVYLTTSNN